MRGPLQPREWDRAFLRRALALAQRGRATTGPNPRVGCVVVDDGKNVVGEGFHRRPGEPHAEVLALSQAGARARGSTLYVNLEPCAHWGRTPPCVEAIIAAGVRRVVASLIDPDPRVGGRGFTKLREAGIEVELGVEAEAAGALNLPFLWPRTFQRPTVTLKWASTLDGALATAQRESRWITGPRARQAALALREEHDVVLVGVETVLADDPRLTRRLGWAQEPIRRVILDRRLRTPRNALLFQEPGPVWIFTEAEPPAEPYPRGTELVVLAQVTPEAVLEELASRQVGSVLVEGGGRVLGAFYRSGCWERLELFLALRLLGGEGAVRPLRGFDPFRLADAVSLDGVQLRRRSPDLQITGYRSGCLRDLCLKLAG